MTLITRTSWVSTLATVLYSTVRDTPCGLQGLQRRMANKDAVYVWLFHFSIHRAREGQAQTVLLHGKQSRASDRLIEKWDYGWRSTPVPNRPSVDSLCEDLDAVHDQTPLAPTSKDDKLGSGYAGLE